MTPRTQVNSATGIMGVSGSGKSSLAATLAKYLFRHYKKVLLYYSSDGGGFPAEVQACIAAGIIRVFRMRTRDTVHQDLAFETCARAAQGWWPKTINPATGEVSPGVEMVPPLMLQYAMRCPQGHLVKTVVSDALLTPQNCPTCKVAVTKSTMLVEKTVQRTPGFEDVGGVFFDGLSSMLSWELMELGTRAGRMELRGEEAAIGGKVSSGDMKFGGTTRSHVGFVQTRGEELVHLSLGIPGLVVPPVFTMLTHEDVDERSLSIRGPKIAGRAKTDEASQWFGNMLEAAKIPAETGSGTQRTLYLQEFTDERGVRHLLKHRGSPGTMPDKLQDPPEGETDPTLAFTQFSLGVFFELLNAALEQRITDVIREFPDAPGLPTGIVQIGGAALQHARAEEAEVQGSALPPAAVPSAPVVGRAPRMARKAPAAATAPATVPVPVQPVQETQEAQGQGEAPLPEAADTPALPDVERAAAPAEAPHPPVPAAPLGTAAPSTTPATRSAPRMAPPAGARPQTPGPGMAQVKGPGAPPSVAPRAPAAAPRPPKLGA